MDGDSVWSSFNYLGVSLTEGLFYFKGVLPSGSGLVSIMEFAYLINNSFEKWEFLLAIAGIIGSSMIFDGLFGSLLD